MAVGLHGILVHPSFLAGVHQKRSDSGVSRIPKTASPAGWKLKGRLLSGFLFAAVAIVCIFGGIVPVTAAVLVLSTLALSEFYALMKVRSYLKGFGYLGNAAVLLLIFCNVTPAKAGVHFNWIPTFVGMTVPNYERGSWPLPIWIPLAAFFFFHFFGHFTGQAPKRKDSLQFQSGALLIGFLWISQTLALSVTIRSLPRGEWWLFLGVAASAMCDIGAYAVGKSFGKHKLAPAISPGKTWEGTVGGMAMCLLTTLFLGHWVMLPWRERVILGMLLAVAAILGDLLESFWKRKIGVKDSGTLVAGHGGMLDRIDSHLLAIPALYLYLQFVNGTWSH